MHALGFYHEQSRLDRDSFVDIDLTPVDPALVNNFDIATTSNSQATVYDFFGVMHYPIFQFGNGAQTIFPKANVTPEPFVTYPILIGQCSGASNTDVDQLRLLYQCSSGPRDLTDVQAAGWCTSNCPVGKMPP